MGKISYEIWLDQYHDFLKAFPPEPEENEEEEEEETETEDE